MQYQQTGDGHTAKQIRWFEDNGAPPALVFSVMDRLGLSTVSRRLSLQTIDQIVSALHNEREDVRVAALRACQVMREHMPVNAVLAVLDDESWNVRATALEVLGESGERAPVESLVAALQDRDATVRAAAVAALGKPGVRTPVDRLIPALRDPDWQVREMAALALGAPGEDTPLKPLVAIVNDEQEDSVVRDAAKMALRQRYETDSEDSEGVEIVDLDGVPEARRVRIPFDISQVVVSHSPSSTKRSLIRRAAEGALAVLLILAIGISWFAMTQRAHQSNAGRGIAPVITPIAHPGRVLFTYHYQGNGTADYPVWSLNGRYLSFIGTDGSVYVWDARTRTIAKTCQLPQLAYNSAGTWEWNWAPDGRHIFLGRDDGLVQVLDAYSGHITLTYTNHAGVWATFGWSPDGRSIALNGNGKDQTVQIFDTNTGQKLLTFQGTLHDVFNLEWSPDGKYIASLSRERIIQIWDATTGKIVQTFPDPDLEYVVWSPDSQHLLAVSDDRMHGDRSVRVWDALTGKLLLVYSKNARSPYTAAWSADGKRILTANINNILVWSAFTGFTPISLPSSPSTGLSWQLSPDGKWLAYTVSSNTIQIWNTITGREDMTYHSPSAAVQLVAWSPDSKRIASVGSDGNAQAWDVTTRSNVNTYNVATSNPGSIVWCSDDTLIALASDGPVMQVLQA